MTQRGCNVTIVAFFDIAFLAALVLCDRLSNPLIEVDAVVHEGCPDAVCDGHSLHASVAYAG